MNFLKTYIATAVLLFCYFQVKAQGADFKVLEPVFTPIGYETGIESIEVVSAFDNPDLEAYYCFVLNLDRGQTSLDKTISYKPICRFDHDERYSSVLFLEVTEKSGFLPTVNLGIQTIDKIKKERVGSQSWMSIGTKNLRQHFQDKNIRISSYKENEVIYFLVIDKDRTIKKYFDVERGSYYDE